jgi:dipeptidyl aminopeptidase/acylaminoacyl peptidase
VLKGVRSELLRYERADGVKLTARLLLPPGYKEGDGPLPVLVWAYPQDYRSADAAGEDEDTPYRFPRVEGLSPRVWLLRGYAVLEGPTMPLLPRDGRPPNDTYVEQLVANARAAVDALVRRGVADRERIAIGGHSYGAAMVATLLAHTDLFRAGLALSGAYNRTLTPFGFQAERRTLWQAPEVYLRASALGAADRIRAPLLLLHGQADPHPSTPFSQSEALYRALVHHGAPARLVGLPGEGHTPRARESVLHALWEVERWLERYVKHAPPRPEGPGRSHVE